VLSWRWLSGKSNNKKGTKQGQMRLTIYDCITTSYCPSEQRPSKDRWNWQTITSSTSHTVLLNIILRVIKESETKKPKWEVPLLKKSVIFQLKRLNDVPSKTMPATRDAEAVDSMPLPLPLPHPCRQLTSNESEAGIICSYLWITWSFFRFEFWKKKKECFFKCSL